MPSSAPPKTHANTTQLIAIGLTIIVLSESARDAMRIVPRRHRSLSQCDSPFSEFRKGYNQPEVNAGLRCDWRKFSIDRPLPRHIKVEWRQTLTNYNISDSETQWQHSWRMMTPAAHPGCFRGSQVPAFPDVKRQGWLKLERILRRAPGRGVCERNRVLEKETHHEPRNAGVNGSECRARLPCALAGAPGGHGRKHKHWPQTDLEMCFLARPGQHCQIEQLHVAELGARAAPGAWYRHQCESRSYQLDERKK